MDQHGETGSWVFQDRDGVEHTVIGTFLGMGTSYRPNHKGHPADGFAPQGVHCSTCRWTEVRIFRDADCFYVVNCGASDAPNERDLVRVTEVSTAFEVVEELTVTDRRTSVSSLPFYSRKALAQAASHDRGLRDAYINSPVT
jgi:hypothetical protein